MATAEMPRSNDVDLLIRAEVPDVPGTALLAVGGYGRQDLYPYSDIDLLLLVTDAGQTRFFSELFRKLWDRGLRVSQSSRTLGECLMLHEGNLELTLSLIDSRYLSGDRSLWSKLEDGFRRMLARKHDEIALGTVKLTRSRHSSFQNTIYHLEPNVKDGPGGLRDIQILKWFAPSPRLTEAHATLARLRNSLHAFYGRDANVLSYAAQDAIGAGPDSVMAEYFRAARKVQRAIDSWMQEEETRSSPLFTRLRDTSALLSTAAYTVEHGRIHLREAQAPQDLRIFELVAAHGLRLSAEAGRTIHDGPFQPECRWPDLEMILSLPYAALALREMHDTGVLGRIFPSWAQVEGLVTRDFYHQYTVDEHTLVAIETVLRLREGPPGPFASLARHTGHLELLLTALLLHDTGKGKGEGSHAEASARSAAPELERIGMPAPSREQVLFLIRAHLEMSRIMTTRDLADPLTARTVAALTGTEERLALLTLMTYADIAAVNPRALTPWRTTLLWQLYAATAELPHPAETTTPTKAGVTVHHENGVWKLVLSALDRPYLFASVAGAISSFGMDIVRAEAFSTGAHVACERFTFTDPFRTLELNPEEAATLAATAERAALGKEDVAKLLERRTRRALPASPVEVHFDQEASHSATVITFTAEDRPGLLYHLAHAISSEGCNIETVLINTEGRKAVDVFYVTASGLKLTAELQQRLAAKIQVRS